MKKLLNTLFLTILLSFLIACGADTTDTEDAVEDADVAEEEAVHEDTESEGESFPLTVTDATGNELTLEEEPERIVSLIPSNTEITFALGQGDKMVGVSDNDNYPEEVLELEQVGGMEFNTEAIIGLEPDIVLAHESGVSYAQEAFDQLDEAGVDVFVVEDAEDFDATYETIEVIGMMIGAEAEAEQLVDGMKEDFSELEELTATIPEEERPSVFFEISPEPDIYTAGANTFFDELLTVIHANNATGEEEGWFAIDPEAIIELNPDVIITTYGDFIDDPREQVTSRDGFDGVEAVINERVYDVDTDLVSRPGPRLAEGAKELAELIYPEQFEEE